jgi:glycosyltransferase involved in cell wall biosynthesis
MDKISIAIPTHDDRLYWFGQTVRNLCNHPAISEIIIVDDASEQNIFDKIMNTTLPLNNLQLYQNDKRLGVFKNKINAVLKCKEKWVALLDSDNVFNVDYIDAFLQCKEHYDINCPVKGLPAFDYSKYSGVAMTAKIAAGNVNDPAFVMAINTGNYIVDRERFLSVLKPMYHSGVTVPYCADVLWMNYHLLSAGQSMYFVPWMEYQHNDHPNSTYRINKQREPGATKYWLDKLSGLK